MTIQEDYLNSYVMPFLECDNPRVDPKKWSRLIVLLSSLEFAMPGPNHITEDTNRIGDAIWFRKRWHIGAGYSDEEIKEFLAQRVSILEIMCSLAEQCEKILRTAESGDRTAWWFWSMVDSMGLADETNDNFHPIAVRDAVNRVNYREYGYCGDGGLFCVPNADTDFRNIELWIQAMRYCGYILNCEAEYRKKGLYG